MITYKLAVRVTGIALGLSLIVLVSPAVVRLLGNDGESSQGVVTRTGEKVASGSLVAIEIGSDAEDQPAESATASDSQPLPDEGAGPEEPPIKKTVRGGKSTKDQAPAPGPGTVPGGWTKKAAKEATRSMPGMMGGPMGSGGMMGGGGMGPGRPPGMGPYAMPKPEKLYVEGRHVILKQSEDAGTLWGYSEKLGKWTKLAIPAGKDLLTPILGDAVGVFMGNGRLYAYSSSTGRWAELKTSATPTVGFNTITARDEGQVFIFSDVNGRWNSNTDATDSTDEPPIVVGINAPVDATRTSPLVDDSGRPIELGDFDSDGRLDVVIHPAPGAISHFIDSGSLRGKAVPESVKKMSAADLLTAYQERSQESERRTIEAAEAYREALRRGGEKVPRTVELRSTLAKLVAESFDRRQQAQRLEAEILRKRLRRVDERLIERERLKSRIIEHRLDELQNTSVRWDAETGKRGTSPSKATPFSDKNSKADTIREFVGRGTASANVGIVSNVSDDGWIELSPAKVFGIRTGDELEVMATKESDFRESFRRFARVLVVEAQPETARARMVESTRTVIDGKYGWEPVLKGYTVSRPIESQDDKQASPHGDDVRQADNENTVRDLLANGIRPHFVVQEPGKNAGGMLMRVRSEPVVCLRGVLPWQEFMQDPALVAKNTPDRQWLGGVELSDFIVERQEAELTKPLWKAIPWNACSIDKSIEVLNSCEDFDVDAATKAVRSEALTSPLPRLVDGTWDERVLHPRLKDVDDNGAARFVLFRFFDFDVHAGQSYRYRVKLRYTASPKGELQPGPWSEPSTVVTVTDSEE